MAAGRFGKIRGFWCALLLATAGTVSYGSAVHQGQHQAAFIAPVAPIAEVASFSGDSSSFDEFRDALPCSLCQAARSAWSWHQDTPIAAPLLDATPLEVYQPASQVVSIARSPYSSRAPPTLSGLESV
jgi:hypothetical protein